MPVNENDICRTVRSLTSAPQIATALDSDWTAWRNHRSRKIKDKGLCQSCLTLSRRAARAKRVARTYGLTVQQHEDLFRRQGGRSPIGRPVTLRSPVDHDHSSGAVRGILDDPTNRFVGYCGDRPEAFLNLWAYLTRPPAQFGLITDHRFSTIPGLVQCTYRGPFVQPVCGRLENEHA